MLGVIFSAMKITLRRYEDGDYNSFRAYAQGMNTTPPTEETYQAFFQHFKSSPENLAIDCDGKFIGNMDLKIDRTKLIAEIGYGLIPDYRGKGLGTIAVGILVQLAFLEKNLKRLWARTTVRNPASIRILEKNGFKQEGCLRSNRLVGDELVDELIYGILREEYVHDT